MALTVRVHHLALAAALSLAACGGSDETADVAGSYTIALTNRDNACAIGNWTVGDTTNGVMVDMTQNGVAISADVKGLAGSALDFLVGAHVFTGTVAGDHLNLAIAGTRGNTMGACAYTYDANLEGDLTGDALQGAIIYQAKTNAAADCGTLTGCASRQDFAGTRPPQ